MTNCIIYTRVSTIEQVENGYSLQGQKEECKEFAQKNGFEILKIFEERGESAKTTDRTELQSMMEFCSNKKNKVNAVILWKIDRLSRNMSDYYFLNSFFNKLNIELLSATETNENNATGKLTRNLLGAFAQYENDQKAERVVTGMKQAFLEGKWLWKAPYGYKMINGNLFPDEEKAPVVKRIFELFNTGLYKQSQIRDILKKDNIFISAGTMFAILRQSLYCGKMFCKTLHTGYVKGDFEAIITEREFNNAQALINGNVETVTSYSRNTPEFPLKRFILCPFCHEPLTASKSTGRRNKKYAYYHCYNKDCKTQVRIPKDLLETKFIDYLTEIKPDKKYIDEFKKYVKESYNNAVKTTKDSISKLNRDLADIQNKKDKLVDIYIDGKLRENDYLSKSKKLDLEEQHIKDCLEQTQLPKDDFEQCVKYVCNSLENLEKLWLESDLDTKQRLQQLIFPHGLIYENNGFRTVSNSWFFSKKGGLLPPDFNMVPPSEFESLSTP